MARNSRHARTRSRSSQPRGLQSTRILPWVLLASATEVVRDRPHHLSIEDRDRLRVLVARAGGRGINLSPRERNEVALILARADRAQARAVPVPLVASRRRRALK